jgi:DNA-binding MarR family transcriptional regulator
MPVAHCLLCGAELEQAESGRPPRYCSAACRQRAYRVRKQTPAPPARQNVRRPTPPTPPVERDVPHLNRRELLAWRGVLEIQAILLPALETELRERTGFTLSEFDVLYQIWRMPDKRRRMVDLSRAVLVTPGGVTRLVARLEDRGLVRRLRSNGRQAVVCELTALGERRLRAAMDVHFDGVREMFVRHLSDVDLDRMIATWTRIRDLNPGR